MGKIPLNRLFGKALRFGAVAALFMAMAGVGAYVALTLIIKGEEAVVVPDLIGRDVLHGLEVLSDLGLNTRVRETVYHDRVPRNHIIDQSPEPGASIKRGRDVRIRVSRGPEAVIVPNLAGLSLQQSRILLTENGLCQGSLAKLSRTGTTAGQVIAQQPAAGNRVVRSQCVDLLISRGAPTPAMAMVDLTGSRLEAALTRLQSLQLSTGTITPAQRPGLEPDVVIAQAPLSGWRVAAGSAVALTVNRQRLAEGQPNALASETTLYRLSSGYGYYNRRYRIDGSGSPLAFTLFDEFVPPGREIWLLTPKNGTPSLRVFVDGRPVDPETMTVPGAPAEPAPHLTPPSLDLSNLLEAVSNRLDPERR